MFHDKNGGDSRIDLYYAGKSLIEETGLSSVDLISILYDKYKIPSNVQMGAVQVEEADPITGMYTICLLYTSSMGFGLWEQRQPFWYLAGERLAFATSGTARFFGFPKTGWNLSLIHI